MVRSHLSSKVNLSKSVQTPCVSPFFVQLEKWHSTVPSCTFGWVPPARYPPSANQLRTRNQRLRRLPCWRLLEAVASPKVLVAQDVARFNSQNSILSLVILPYNDYTVYIINDCNCNLMRYPNG